MTDRTHQQGSGSGSLHLQLSNTVVRLLREHTGRGPTKPRILIRDNVILVLPSKTLIKGERSLAEKGRSARCSKSATSSKKGCARRAAARWPELTGWKVVATVSANHPDLAAGRLGRNAVQNLIGPKGTRDAAFTDSNPSPDA